MSAPAKHRYSLDHFMALTGWTLSQVQDVAPCNGTEWRTRKQEGVTEFVADRIACAAGLHPHEVWPEMLDHALEAAAKACAADDCSDDFVPTDARQRFCSKRCKSRAWQQRQRRDAAYRKREAERRRGYYAESAEYERRREQRRYWANPERYRAARRDRYRREQQGAA